MTSKEYVIWFKGFVEACESQPTSKQWGVLKNKLAEIDDSVGTPIGSGFGVPNTHPFSTWQEPHRTMNPYIGDTLNTNPIIYNTNPVISTTPNGTGGSSGVITTTPGVGSISIASGTGIGSTSTTHGYPSGSSWSYTNI
jgi:hypothetical protein